MGGLCLKLSLEGLCLSMQFPVFLLCASAMTSQTASVVAKRQGHVLFQMLGLVHLTGLPFIPRFTSALPSYSC